MRIEANYAKAAKFIQDAASQGAQLAVLPEYHLTNWVPEDPQFSDLCGQWETYLTKYRDLAKEHNICIVPGTIVERHEDVETKEWKLVNVAYFIDNQGEVLGRYQKKNLWHPERPHLTSSTNDPHEMIQTPLGPIGLLICWDLAFPEAFRELITGGAKMIIIPTFCTPYCHSLILLPTSYLLITTILAPHALTVITQGTLTDSSPYGLSLNPRSEALFLSSILTARAFENTCAVVFVNAGGPSHNSNSSSNSNSNYAGLSRVAVPFLGALGDETKDSSAEGMSIVDVDMRLVEEAEANYRVREDLKREDWWYGYRRGRGNGCGKL
ncbi:MAG: hypothetical protein Q9188_002438 [Gyalolechia gomerana]